MKEPHQVVPPPPQTVVEDVRPSYPYHTEQMCFSDFWVGGIRQSWVVEMHNYINRFSESMGYDLLSCRPTIDYKTFLFIWKKK